MRYAGRFAPSPTGSLHLGSVATALFALARAKQHGGSALLRIEDLDRPRVLPGIELEQREDLAWLGLDFADASAAGVGPTHQSQRLALYDAAIANLESQGLTYLCDCSRAEIARVASAPHEGDEGPRYPETCRPLGMTPRAFKRAPAVRLAAPHGVRTVAHDVVLGPLAADVHESVGDFVLKRGDGVVAYQLAVVVDDLAMGVTEIVRGVDLRTSAPRQALLASLLGGALPPVLHVPLLVGHSGQRLAKRDRGSSVRELRERGKTPNAILGALAAAYGHPVRATGDVVLELAKILEPSRLPAGPVAIHDVEAAA